MHFLSILQTAAAFLGAILVSAVCGYGALTLLLPDELEEYRFVILVPFGYTFFGWITYLVSGNFGLNVNTSAIVAFSSLAVLSGLAAWRRRIDTARSAAKRLLRALALGLPIILVILWPLFWVGADTFIGANNPDWFASFVDIHFLMENSVRTLSTYGADPYNIIQQDLDQSN
jgi:hypothetical protein